MKITFQKRCLLLAVCLLFSSIASVSLAKGTAIPAPQLSNIKGTVEILLPTGLNKLGQETYDTKAWKPANSIKEFPIGTIIKTAEKSSVLITFGEAMTLELAASTQFKLGYAQQKHVYQLELGRVLVNMPKSLDDVTFDIMRARCKGQSGLFAMEFDGYTSTLKVLEGTVEMVATFNEAAELVTKGQTLSVADGAFENLQSFDVPKERASWKTLDGGTDTTLVILLIVAAVVVLCALVFVFRKNKRSTEQTASTTDIA